MAQAMGEIGGRFPSAPQGRRNLCRPSGAQDSYDPILPMAYAMGYIVSPFQG